MVGSVSAAATSSLPLTSETAVRDFGAPSVLECEPARPGIRTRLPVESIESSPLLEKLERQDLQRSSLCYDVAFQTTIILREDHNLNLHYALIPWYLGVKKSQSKFRFIVLRCEDPFATGIPMRSKSESFPMASSRAGLYFSKRTEASAL
jgi:hypothetical protein